MVRFRDAFSNWWFENSVYFCKNEHLAVMKQNVERTWSNMKWRYVFVRLYSLSTNPKGHAERVVRPLKQFRKCPQLICDPLWYFSDLKNQFFSVCAGSRHTNLSIMKSEVFSPSAELYHRAHRHCMKLICSIFDNPKQYENLTIFLAVLGYRYLV